MRPLIFLAILFCNLTFAQNTKTSKTAIEDGRTEFKIQEKSESPDFSKAKKLLTDRLKKFPNDAETRYFLGYIYDRESYVYDHDAWMINRDLSIKASEQFEKVNELEPIYKGEIIILDPYSKISSIWGALAGSYMVKNKIDSATWAFQQGKKRGGFIEPILSYNRQLLKNCSKNSILFTSGDLYTLPMLYLQTIEKYRTDVTIIDTSLINTAWYIRYLEKYKNLQIDLNKSDESAIIAEISDNEKVYMINPNNKNEKIVWNQKNNYTVKGELVILNFLKKNLYLKDIYFTPHSSEEIYENLSESLIEEGIVEKLSAKNISNREFNLKEFTIDDLNAEDILRSTETWTTLNGYRYAYSSKIKKLIKNKKFKEANVLLIEMQKKFNPKKLPYYSVDQEDNIKKLAIIIKENL